MSVKREIATHPVIIDVQDASALLRKHSSGNALSEALADFLDAIARFWLQGWLPAIPTEQDKAIVQITQLVIAKYKAPDIGAGNHQK